MSEIRVNSDSKYEGEAQNEGWMGGSVSHKNW